MNPLHLYWIIPACIIYGFLINGLITGKEPKPNTNGNRIRSMNDRELAAFLMQGNYSEWQIPFCQNKTECCNDIENIPEKRCLDCLVSWIQKEAE